MRIAKSVTGLIVILVGLYLVGMAIAAGVRQSRLPTPVPSWRLSPENRELREQEVEYGLPGLLVLFAGMVVLMIRPAPKPPTACPKCASATIRRANSADLKRINGSDRFVIRMPFVCDACNFLTDSETGGGEIAFTLILTACGIVAGASLFAIGAVVFVCRLFQVGGESHTSAAEESKFYAFTLIGGGAIFTACLGTLRRLFRRRNKSPAAVNG